MPVALFNNKRQGFTLIELLAVIAIIGLLATLSFAALKNASLKARNTKRLSNIKQYITAMQLYYSDYGGYPTTDTSNGSRCLGNYPDNLCWLNGTSVGENANLNNSLSTYYPTLPVGDTACSWEGYLFFRNVTASPAIYYIDWIMEGISANCGQGVIQIANYNTSGCTYCRYTLEN